MPSRFLATHEASGRVAGGEIDSAQTPHFH